METDIKKRSNKLIAEFADGFAVGWKMAVSEFFRNELDIKLLPRKKQKQSFYEWSQGPYYCFSEGQIIYDTATGYQNWGLALKKIELACQIIEAKPNALLKTEDTGGKTFSLINGYVKFLLLKPNHDRSKLEDFACYNLSQNSFVDFLRTGEISGHSVFSQVSNSEGEK